MPRPPVDPDALRARLGDRVRTLAERRKLPVTRLADAAGISRAMLFRVLSGKTPATTDTIAKLAGVLGVDPMELLREPPQAKATKKAKATEE